MGIEITETPFQDLFVLEPMLYHDNRGFFLESYNQIDLKQKGLIFNFIQDNHSLSKKKGTVRGIHYQSAPFEQTKLVRCIRGEIIDYAVDLRPDSTTYLKWFSINLSSTNHKQLLIPRGFGHAFVTLKENTEVLYKIDNAYSKVNEHSINYLDPIIDIQWPEDLNLTLSEKDLNAPFGHFK